jgi:hypothetical protein
MEVQLAAAIVAGTVALTTAAATVWGTIRNAERTARNARDIEDIKNARAKEAAAAARQAQVSRYSEPLARAAYDLQSRIFNLLRQNFAGVYMAKGTPRARDYAVENTTFVICQYFCWTELTRRELQFIDLGEDSRTRRLTAVQDQLYHLWGSDRRGLGPMLRLFAGEQRAIGEALIVGAPGAAECIGYGGFLTVLGLGTNPLIDVVRDDVATLAGGTSPVAKRLTDIQHKLVDLLDLLDPDALRFPQDSRSKL